jgi:hypothetical protein
MKKLFNINLDVTDYLLSNDVETVANVVNDLSGMAKTASVHSSDERDKLSDENVALILYHPNIGELRKFACDTGGITEINLGILSENINSLPEELIKIAANNLGYVATHEGISIPDNLKIYQTNSWVDPYLDTTRLDKVAFYEKLQSKEEQASPPIFEKKSETMYDTKRFNEDLVPNVKARLKFTQNEKIAELYNDVIEKYSSYTPEEIVKVLKAADEAGNMDKAIKRGMFKSAEASTYAMLKTSWFTENVGSLKDKELPYLSKTERSALFSEEGEDVFNSLPKPTKDKLMGELGK